MQRRRIVLVLTMGASGSSVLTRGLKAFGLNLGDNVLNQSLPINEKGVWENADFFYLCWQILESLHTGPDKMDGVGQIDSNKIPEDLRNKAIKLVEKNTDNNDIFGFKNTMSWKIIPFWKSLFNQLSIYPTYIIVVRNPADVADSMYKKIKGKKAKIYMLWLEYIATIMNDLHGENKLVVDYDQLMANPKGQMQRIANILGINEDGVDKADFQEYLDEFIDSNLRHNFNNSPDKKINEEAHFSELTQRSYKLLQDLSVDNLSIECLEVRNFFQDCYQQLMGVGRLIKNIGSIEDSLLSLSSAMEDALLELVRGAAREK